jgi:hypothetical protein
VLDPDDIIWCLICDQRPAEGMLRRLFSDSMAPVISDPRAVTPRVCQSCADQVHGMPGLMANGRPTTWDYVLEDPTYSGEEDCA